MNLLNKVWRFFKNPKYVSYTYSPELRRKVLLNLLGYNLIISITIGIFTELLKQLLNIDTGGHGVEQMFKKYNAFQILLLAIILAPLIEELIFRAPLALFKKSKYFAIAYYLSVFLFGIVHIFNFENFENAIFLIPLLVLPQIVSGVFLGYIRVRMGLISSILFHAAFNCILIGPSLFFKSISELFH